MAIAGTGGDLTINKLTMTPLMKGKCSGARGGRPRESSSSCSYPTRLIEFAHRLLRLSFFQAPTGPIGGSCSVFSLTPGLHEQQRLQDSVSVNLLFARDSSNENSPQA